MIDEYFIRVENLLREISDTLKQVAGKGPEVAGAGPASYLDDFNELKGLLASDRWPVAVEPDLICKDDLEEKKIRAEGVIDFMITEPLGGKRFLDFGCGEGLTIPEAVRKGASAAVGYDARAQWSAASFAGGGVLTDDWQKVRASGPYDVVMLWDVLDHLTGEDPIDALKKVKEVCKPGAAVYVRCHPWCSRSATHTYRSLNKAFTHLVFSEVELVRLGITGGEPTLKVVHPQMTYTNWFQVAGFAIAVNDPATEDVEKFFSETPVVAARVKANWSGSQDQRLASGESFPDFQMRQHFIDFVLKPQ